MGCTPMRTKLLFVVLGTVFDLACSRMGAPSKGSDAWRFIEVRGQVSVNGKGATAGMPLGRTDEVTTAADGFARVSVGEGSLVEVRENTHLRFGASSRRRISVNLLAGRLWSFFEKPTDYEVVSRNAVAGVRGTVFFADATDPNMMAFCGCRGKLHVTTHGPGDADDEPTVDEDVDGKDWGHAPVVIAPDGKRIPMDGPPPGWVTTHSTATGKEIEALIHAQAE